MKKLCLFFLFTIVIISFSNAQDFKPKYILAGNLFFTQKNTDASFLPKGYNLFDQSFGVNPSFGFILGKGFALGIGIDFQYSSKNEISSFEDNDGYYFQEKIKNGNNYGPLVYLKYVYPLNNKISIGLKFKTAYLVQKSNTRIEPANWVDNNGDITYDVSTPLFGFTPGLFEDEPKGVFQSMLVPEVQYKITPFIGLQASFNGLLYSVNRYKLYGKNVSNSVFSFELNPSNWQFGVFFLLGDKQNTGTI